MTQFNSSSKNLFIANQDLFNKVIYVVYDGALRQCKLVRIETKFVKVENAISIHQQAILNVAQKGCVAFKLYNTCQTFDEMMAIRDNRLYLYLSVDAYKANVSHQIDCWVSKISKEMQLTDVVDKIANQGRKVVFTNKYIGIQTYKWNGVKAEKQIVSLPNIVQYPNGLYFEEEFDTIDMYGDAKECTNMNEIKVVNFNEKEESQNNVQMVLDELFQDCKTIQNHLQELCDKLR